MVGEAGERTEVLGRDPTLRPAGCGLSGDVEKHLRAPVDEWASARKFLGVRTHTSS